MHCAERTVANTGFFDMPRRKRRPSRDSGEGRKQAIGEFGRTGFEWEDTGPDGFTAYTVQTIPAQRARKNYRCPGCDQVIAVGIAHVVAWPREESVEQRRHWHRGCWNGRHTRRALQR